VAVFYTDFWNGDANISECRSVGSTRPRWGADRERCWNEEKKDRSLIYEASPIHLDDRDRSPLL